MIKLDDKTKQLCKKYLGADGKFIINDSTPSDLVDLFQYFNDNDINVLTLELDDVIVDNSEDDQIDDNIEDYDFDSNEPEDFSEDEVSKEESLSNAALNDLEDFF